MHWIIIGKAANNFKALAGGEVTARVQAVCVRHATRLDVLVDDSHAA